MGKKVVYVVGGVVVSIIALKILGPLIGLLIVLGIVALPVVGYMMLDPSQRRRVRAQGRKRLGS
ncbi:hypothetical protein ACFOY4_13145 [Actinomadura syzygii]|uniref:Uncharacterized protein n=1 Tax=Actinomadura syzygii TaxID=1427538 RepID=A0A5D0U892_9ACTN|nr:hypothetical protein [Actinomadura syzygii]TYC13872.1 hypothetical protein FXF65_19680 [Actinomadura syzygii]